MDDDKTTRRIAWEAATLLRSGSEKDWQQARRVATRRLVRGRLHPDRLPKESDIRGALLALFGEPLAPPTDAVDGQRSHHAQRSPEARFAEFLMLLRPLETILRSRETHPEGDALYHSLQVFALVREEVPYDEELLLAALLHEVGLAEDRSDPIPASIELLGDAISQRTGWLIENHVAIRAMYDGSISARRRRSLRQHPWFEELVILAEADRDGRQVGVMVPDEQEALDYIAGLDDQ